MGEATSLCRRNSLLMWLIVAQVQEELAVASGSVIGDGVIAMRARRCSAAARVARSTTASCTAGSVTSHSLADFIAAGLELRFDERHDVCPWQEHLRQRRGISVAAK